MAQFKGNKISRLSGSSGGGGSGSGGATMTLLGIRQRMTAALSKLADRDTQKMAMDELDHILVSLPPEAISTCLACLYETADVQQKSTARRECIRMFGSLASLHGSLLSPHLHRIMNGLAKRLHDPDSTVRDALAEAMGTLVSHVPPPAPTPHHPSADPLENGAPAPFSGPLSVFFKPLFDALSEQNRSVQTGAAICLARVIENLKDPHPAMLQRLCPRILKYLASHNFAAKASLIVVVGSIVQTGAALSNQCLASLVSCVQAALKSTDWATRKAASETLANMAISASSSLVSFKSSSLDALESGRFDKVKPVRDSVIQTLQIWKNISDSGSDLQASDKILPVNECTDQQSCPSTRIDGNGELHAVFKSKVHTEDNTTGFGQNRLARNKISGSNEKKGPLPPPLGRKVGSIDSCDTLNSLQYNAEGEGCDGDFDRERKTGFYENGLVGSEAEIDSSIYGTCNSAMSKLEADRTYSNISEKVASRRTTEDGHQNSVDFAEKRIFEEHVKPRKGGGDYGLKITKIDSSMNPSRQEPCVEEDPSSLSAVGTGLKGSTSSSGPINVEVSNDATDLSFIKRQLCQIEAKQSSLLETLMEFMRSSQKSLHGLETRVRGVEDAVDHLAQDVLTGKYESASGSCYGKFLGGADFLSSKFWKKNDGRTSFQDRPVAPETLFTSVIKPQLQPQPQPQPRGILCESSSVGSDTADKQSSRLIAASKTRKNGTSSWSVHVNVLSDSLQSNRRNGQEDNFRRIKTEDQASGGSIVRPGGGGSSFGKVSRKALKAGEAKSNEGIEVRSEKGKGPFWSLWNRAMEFLQTGDTDSAYVEVICSGDEVLLARLMSRTGPVLEKLSSETATELLRMALQLLLQQSFLDVVLPWFQQMVDLGKRKGPENMALLTMDFKRELVGSLQRACALDFSEPWIAEAVGDLTLQLAIRWGVATQQRRVLND